MNNIYFKNILRFVLLIMLQVMLFNHLNIWGYLNPFAYVLIIMLLPFRTNKMLMLVLAFITGMTIDVFGDTPGLHSAATVFIAFLRPGIISVLFGKIEYAQNEEPGLSKLGLGGFARYSAIMVLIHNFTIFLLEYLSITKIFAILKTTIFNSILSLVMIFILMFLFSRRKK